MCKLFVVQEFLVFALRASDDAPYLRVRKSTVDLDDLPVYERGFLGNEEADHGGDLPRGAASTEGRGPLDELEMFAIGIGDGVSVSLGFPSR